ncbi:TlpA disulfide reductase family protein [Crateriforma spongiae]|uniref:TlpA disulfide reductase family protein n=1 Tax=Crateriforma spongiae TaxID=2724528 RepID=UPI00144898B3|nr:TlpA disulfide reductase family protein [Crateriforma spongiae]
MPLNFIQALPAFPAAVIAIAVSMVATTANGEPAPLSIGDKAPALAIEHWIQDGNGYFKPVEKFDDGTVYVVEFWATWCPPCVASMPHLAELQDRYRGNDVQIISVSTEPLSTIEPFLEQEHPQVESTVAEITSRYCLTTDPDESVYTDYMLASNQNGIPMAFLVGKTGQIEWIGHPMRLDEPLQAVIDGDWDRKAFKQQFDAEQRGRELGVELSRLYSANKIDEAIELLDREIDATQYEPFKELLINLRYEIRFESDRLDEDVLKFYRQRLKEAKTDPNLMTQLSLSTLNALRRESELQGFDDEVIAAMRETMGDLSPAGVVQAQQILTQMYLVRGQNDQALQALQQAVDKAEGGAKERLQVQLERLTEQLNPTEPEDDSADDEDDS